jgi:hypothetical protein
MEEKSGFCKKLSWCITREGSTIPFRNDYTYKFKSPQFLEEIDDPSGISSYSHNEYKQMVIDQLITDFRFSLNQIVFGDPAGKEYVEQINAEKELDMNLKKYSDYLRSEYKTYRSKILSTPSTKQLSCISVIDDMFESLNSSGINETKLNMLSAAITNLNRFI